MRVKRAVVGGKNLLGVLFQVVKLAGMQRPAEDRDDPEHEHGGQGNEQVEDVHCACRHRASRSEFTTTTSVLVAIPNPAAQGGSQPANASGTQAAL